MTNCRWNHVMTGTRIFICILTCIWSLSHRFLRKPEIKVEDLFINYKNGTVSARDTVGIPSRILPSLIEKKTLFCQYTIIDNHFLSSWSDQCWTSKNIYEQAPWLVIFSSNPMTGKNGSCERTRSYSVSMPL